MLGTVTLVFLLVIAPAWLIADGLSDIGKGLSEIARAIARGVDEGF